MKANERIYEIAVEINRINSKPEKNWWDFKEMYNLRKEQRKVIYDFMNNGIEFEY